MRAPGGTSSGTRWLPLARWCLWPEYALPTLAAIIQRESSGREHAYNPSGAAGILQLMPGWYRGQWGVPAGDPFDAMYSLKTGLLMWKKVGFQPWAL